MSYDYNANWFRIDRRAKIWEDRYWFLLARNPEFPWRYLVTDELMAAIDKMWEDYSNYELRR
jgi:hypothetical protein